MTNKPAGSGSGDKNPAMTNKPAGSGSGDKNPAMTNKPAGSGSGDKKPAMTNKPAGSGSGGKKSDAFCDGAPPVLRKMCLGEKQKCMEYSKEKAKQLKCWQ